MKVPWKVGVVIMSIWLMIAAPTSVRTAHAFTQSNTFGWREVPENQDVPIRRAVFDRGGYLLYDTVGEVIAVPFAGHSTCALKFHRSYTGSMYLVNRGWAPVLYVPANDCLYNGTVSNGCWYPFAHGYDPVDPVYMSCAPTYTDYCDMGWYPGMTCYGCYYSPRYVDPGAAFLLAVGLIFLIDGHHYDGWHPYYAYWHDHRDFRPIGFYDPPAYHWAARPFGGRSFVGTRHIMALRSMHNGGFHGFAGGQHAFNGRVANGHFGGGRVFQGTASAIHNRNLQRMAHGGGAHAFQGRGVHRTASVGGARRVAHIAQGFSGHTFRSANRSFGGGTTYFHHRAYNGSGGFAHRSFNAGGGSFARRSFGGGGFTHRSFNTGGFERHSFGGGGGGAHFGGGGGHFGGGGGGHFSGGGGGGHSGGGGGGRDHHR